MLPMGRCLLVVVVVAGCYRPTFQLDVPCTAEGECPSGQMCVRDRCIADGTDPESHDDAAVADGSRDALGPSNAPLDAPAAGINFVSERHVLVDAVDPVTSISIPNPSCPPGDLMIGVIAMGVSGAMAAPVITAPNGWSLFNRINHPNDLALATYLHVAGANEPMTHTWMFSSIVEGAAWIACYANVDVTDPIDDDNDLVSLANGPGYPFPSVSPDVPNTLLVGIVAGHGGMMASWTPPATVTERLDLANATSRSITMVEKLDLLTGPTAMLTETASVAQDFALFQVLALTPK